MSLKKTEKTQIFYLLFLVRSNSPSEGSEGTSDDLRVVTGGGGSSGGSVALRKPKKRRSFKRSKSRDKEDTPLIYSPPSAAAAGYAAAAAAGQGQGAQQLLMFDSDTHLALASYNRAFEDDPSDVMSPKVRSRHVRSRHLEFYNYFDL